jgi:hypothetical protein
MPHCAWPKCLKPVKLGRYRWYLFCREHWKMLPPAICSELIAAENNHTLDSRAVKLALDYSERANPGSKEIQMPTSVLIDGDASKTGIELRWYEARQCYVLVCDSPATGEPQSVLISREAFSELADWIRQDEYWLTSRAPES